LGTLDGSLGNFGRSFGASANGSATASARKKGSASFGCGSTKEACSAKGCDVGHCFEEGLGDGGCKSGAGCGGASLFGWDAGFFLDLDLTLDVLAGKLWKASSRAANQAASNDTGKAEGCTEFGTADGTCETGRRSGKGACHNFSGCPANIANALCTKEAGTQIAGEGGFGFLFVANAAPATELFEAGQVGDLTQTFGRREQGTLELINASGGCTSGRRADA
jgi:hypothetical protein